jgi:hypothetical protein
MENMLRELEQRDGHRRRIIPVDEHEKVISGDSERIIEVHKNVSDPTKWHVLVDGAKKGPLLPNQPFLELIRTFSWDESSYLLIGGKIAEVCLRAGARSLIAEFPQVRVVMARDAISSLPEYIAQALGLPTKSEVMDELSKLGAKVQDTQEILDWLTSLRTSKAL